MSAKLTTVARICLAIVFLISGISKAISSQSTSALLERLITIEFLSGSVLTISLALVEITLACLLLTGKTILITSLLSSLFFLVAAAIGVIFIDSPVDCGCFGDLIESKTDAIFLIRNLVFLYISLLVLKAAR